MINIEAFLSQALAQVSFHSIFLFLFPTTEEFRGKAPDLNLTFTKFQTPGTVVKKVVLHVVNIFFSDP